jgi:hypothetical protein
MLRQLCAWQRHAIAAADAPRGRQDGAVGTITMMRGSSTHAEVLLCVAFLGIGSGCAIVYGTYAQSVSNQGC